MTDITPAKTIIKVQGQTVAYEEMTDEQVDDALVRMTPTQQRIIGLAGRGLRSQDICSELSIKPTTLTTYKKAKAFRDCFYTVSQVHIAVTIETVKKVARADALDSYLNIRSLSLGDVPALCGYRSLGRFHPLFISI